MLTPVLILVGLVAGLLGGVLGIGGGVVTIPILILLGVPLPVAISTNLLAVTLTAASGAYRHYRLGTLDLRVAKVCLIGGFMGIAIGTAVYEVLKAIECALDLALAIFFSYVLYGMYTRSQVRTEGKGGTIKWFLTGLLASFVSGVAGIGGGVIMVPLLLMFGVDPRKVAGTSLSVFLWYALAGSVYRVLVGDADLVLGLPIGLGCSIGAYIGATISRRVPVMLLKLALSVLILYTLYNLLVGLGRCL